MPLKSDNYNCVYRCKVNACCVLYWNNLMICETVTELFIFFEMVRIFPFDASQYDKNTYC